MNEKEKKVEIIEEDYDKAIKYIINGLDEALLYLQRKYPTKERDELIDLCKEIADGMWY